MKKGLSLFVVLAILIATTYLGYRFIRSPKTAQSYYESALAYYRAGQYPEARIQLMNALGLDGGHRDSRYLLALSYLRQQQGSLAVQQLKTLLESHPEDIQASLQLGNLYLAAGPNATDFFREAKEIGARILAKDPNNVGALILSGNASARLQDHESSVKQLERALTLDPDNISATLNLGSLQALREHYPEAEKAFLRARELDPKNKNALMSLAAYYQGTGSLDKAEGLLKEAFALFPADRDVCLRFVQYYSQRGRSDSAEMLLLEFRKRNPRDPEQSLPLVDFYLSRNRLADARTLLTSLRDEFPDDIQTGKRLALISLKSDPDLARKVIEDIIKRHPGRPEGHILLGQLQFFSGEHNAAEATLKKDVVLNSSLPEARFFLGRIAAIKGQKDLALAEFQKALQLKSGYLAARVALAEILMDKGRLSDTREELRKVLQIDPDNLGARLLQATVDTLQRHYSEAERELSKLLGAYGDNAQVHRRMGFYLKERGRIVEAEKHYLRAVELQPNSTNLWSELIEFWITNRLFDNAIRSMDRIPEPQKQAFHYELMGRVHFEAGKFHEAEVALRKALERDPNRSLTNLMLAASFLQTGRMEEGLRILDDLRQKNPQEASIHGFSGLIYENLSKPEKAKQAYRQALQIDANLATAANNLAYIMAEEGQDLTVALKWAQTARRQDPENGSYADTLGWLYYKLGNYVLAIDQLRFAASKNPDSPAVLYHLALAYRKNKQLAEAEKTLRKALQSNKPAKERALAEAALQEVLKERSRRSHSE